MKAKYNYSAAGQKLSVKDATGANSFDYLGSLTLAKTNNITTPEVVFAHGIIRNGEVTYFDKDHLGSVRTTVNKNGTVTGTNDYYPFGMVHSGGLINPNNRYLFNGKENQTIGDLRLTDFDWRMLDSELGRWFVIDPLAGKYYRWSPYNYAINNPISFIDPDGREIEFSENTSTWRTVVFTVDGVTYTGMIPAADLFIAGNHYTYPVTVSKTSVAFGTASITRWTTSDHGTGEALPQSIYTAAEFTSFADAWNATEAITNDEERAAAQGKIIAEWSDNGRPDDDYVGLFGYVGEEGTVKDVEIVDAKVTGKKFTGIVVGSNYGTVKGCTVTGANTTVAGKSYVGGVAGENFGKIGGAGAAGCTFSGTFSGTSGISGRYVVGVVGSNQGGIAGSQNSSTIPTQDRSLITGCWSLAQSVKNELATNYEGGLSGINYQNSILTYSYWLAGADVPTDAVGGNIHRPASCGSFTGPGHFIQAVVNDMNTAIAAALAGTGVSASWPYKANSYPTLNVRMVP